MIFEPLASPTFAGSTKLHSHLVECHRRNNTLDAQESVLHTRFIISTRLPPARVQKSVSSDFIALFFPPPDSHDSPPPLTIAGEPTQSGLQPQGQLTNKVEKLSKYGSGRGAPEKPRSRNFYVGQITAWSNIIDPTTPHVQYFYSSWCGGKKICTVQASTFC